MTSSFFFFVVKIFAIQIIFLISTISHTILSSTTTVAAENNVIEDDTPSCPTIEPIIEKYHYDTTCNKIEQNIYKRNMGRYETWQKLKSLGGPINAHIPDEKTIYCPETGTFQSLTSSQTTTIGFDTSWIVENTATIPVVIGFVKTIDNDPFFSTLTQIVSPFNHAVSPPQIDTRSILQPGQFTSIMTQEGEEFIVREYNPNNGQVGRILLQHLVGMIPIRNKYGHVLPECSSNLQDDPEPKITIKTKDQSEQEEEEEEQIDPNYQRHDLSQSLRLCNVIDIGFRNTVGCPINGYYIGHHTLTGFVKPRGNVTNWKEFPKTCYERFEMHLGNLDATQDFYNDWRSPTKYESAYIGQQFLFRLASNEEIVLDSYTVSPTKIIDCPSRKKQQQVVAARSNNIATEIEIHTTSKWNQYSDVENNNNTITYPPPRRNFGNNRSRRTTPTKPTTSLLQHQGPPLLTASTKLGLEK